MSNHPAQYITRARCALQKEEARLRDEIDALRAFERRLTDVSPATTTSQMPAGPTSVHVSSAGPSHRAGLERVRESYRETVMAVPHYDEDYGDSLDESLAEEFGPEIATALRTQSALSPMVKSRLVEAVRTSVTQRETFQEALRAELRSLSRAEDAVTSLSTTVDSLHDPPLSARHLGQLFALWETTCDLRSQCDAAAAERQRTLPTETVALADEQVPRIVYYYRSLDVDYPALNDLARLGERIDELQASIERYLTRF